MQTNKYTRVQIPNFNRLNFNRIKKIIGILGVAVIAATMFFSANTVSSTNDTDLSSIIAIDAANAEDSCAGIYYFCKPGGSYCYNWTYQHYRYDSGLC